MNDKTPEERITQAADELQSLFSQYKRKHASGEFTGSFEHFADIKFTKEINFRTKQAHNPETRQMGMELLQQAEIGKALMMSLDTFGNFIETTHIGKPRLNDPRVRLAAEGKERLRDGSTMDLSSTSLRKMYAGDKPAASGILMAGGSNKTGAPAIEKPSGNEDLIQDIAMDAFSDIAAWQKQGLSNDAILANFEAEKESINADFKSGKASINPNIVGELRKAELGMWLASQPHPEHISQNDHRVKLALKGETPDLPGNKSQSGNLAARLDPAATPVDWREKGIPTAPAVLGVPYKAPNMTI